MDLIYAVHRKPLKHETPYLESVSGTSTLCTISQENIIAFTSLTDLTDKSGESWGCHVYVVDMNAPWYPYKVCTTIRQVSALEWDTDGKYLMVCTMDGEIMVYTTKQWVLSEWFCLYKGNFNGEHIIKCCFFHNGRRIVPCPDKKFDVPSTERYTHVKMAPTLKGFGGAPLDGGCVLTTSGLIGVFGVDRLTCETIPDTRQLTLTIQTDSLSPTRQFIRSADIAYSKGGSLICAWWCAGRVRCASAKITHALTTPPTKSNGLNPKLELQPFASFFLNQDSKECNKDPSSVIVRWRNKEEADTLLVVHDQTIELWSLRETSVPLHPLFAKGFPVPGSTTPGGGAQKPSVECVNTVKWRLLHTYKWQGVCVPKCMSSNNAHVLLTLNDDTAHLLTSDTLQHILTIKVDMRSISDDVLMESTPAKQIKYEKSDLELSEELCCCLSPLGGVALFVDSTSQMYLYSIPYPAVDLGSSTWMVTACGLLEYSIISGIDCLDILLTLPTSAIDTLHDRMSDWFPRQSPAFQQFYHIKWLCLCAALSRLSATGLSRSIDLMVNVMLHTISNTFKSLHRPSETPIIEKNDTALEDQIDCDKLTIDISVEPLHSIRLAVQRIVDAGLRALARDSYPNNSILRECITMCRSFLGNRGGATADTLNAIFRLISRDHSNSEEILALLSQTGISKGADEPPTYAVAMYHNVKRPYIFEYNIEPDYLKSLSEQINLENVNVTDTPMDTIRYWFIGSRGVRRGCARCGARGVSDNRHRTHCRCGGRWSIQSTV